MKTEVIISILICLLQVLAKRSRLPAFYFERDMFGNIDVQRHALRASKKLERVSSSARRNFPAIEGHFRQKLDHFDDCYVATWQQLYYYNFKYSNHTRFKYAFLMVGGAGPLPPSDDAGEPHISNENNIVVQWAKQYGAALFALEHRFYGKSRPTADMSVENLKYLNSRQAIEDIAYFIRKMNKRYGDPIWIVFGASYSGSLALWARQKYPELIAGVVASSAPLEITLDFWGLKDGIGGYTADSARKIFGKLLQK